MLQVSSEEDVPIFHRALRTPTSEDGDDRELDAMLAENKDEEIPSTKQVLQPLHIDTADESNLAKSLGNLATMLGIGTDTAEQSSADSIQSIMMESIAQSSTSKPESSTRPSTAPVLREFNRRPKVKKDNWMEQNNKAAHTEPLNIEDKTPETEGKTSCEDVHEEKRKEIPELSPKVEEKRRRSVTERPDDLVHQYLPISSAVLPLDHLDIGR